MPTTENDRRNSQEPVLKNPSLPDHDRMKDAGMNAALLDDTQGEDSGDLVDTELVAPDQEFGEILQNGLKASQGLIPEDPNNWLTSDQDPTSDDDPESRGESLPDIMDGGNNS